MADAIEQEQTLTERQELLDSAARDDCAPRTGNYTIHNTEDGHELVTETAVEVEVEQTLRVPLLQSQEDSHSQVDLFISENVCATPRRFLLQQQNARIERARRLRNLCVWWCSGIVIIGIALVGLFFLIPKLPDISFGSDVEADDRIYSKHDGLWCNGTETITIRNPNPLPIKLWGTTMTVYYKNFYGENTELGSIEAIDGNVHQRIPGHGSKTITIPFDLGPFSRSFFDTCFSGLKHAKVQLYFIGHLQVENLSGRHSIQWEPRESTFVNCPP